MSQLLSYWEEADRCRNQGEMKIKTHCPLSKLLLKFSSQSKAFMLVNPVVDPGEGPGPLLFHQNEARRAEKIFFGDPPPPPPSLSEGLDLPLQPAPFV